MAETPASPAPETPVVVLLPYSTLQYLLEIVNAPATLDGPGVMKKASLLRAIAETVTVDHYNHIIVTKLLDIQAKQRAEALEKLATKTEEPRQEPHAPRAANQAANFVPHRVKMEQAAAKPVAPLVIKKKAIPEKAKPAPAKKVAAKKKAPAKAPAKKTAPVKATPKPVVKKKHSW